MTGRSREAKAARSGAPAPCAGPPPPGEAKAAYKSRYRRRLDPEGNPLGPIPKANETVQVPRALTSDEERTLAEVARWVRQGRSSRATPLSELVDDGDWTVPNIRLSRARRTMCWWKLCALHAISAHRDQLADFRALVERIEGQDTDDDMALARGLALAAALIQAISGRERKFVRQRGLDQPEEVEEQRERELG